MKITEIEDKTPNLHSLVKKTNSDEKVSAVENKSSGVTVIVCKSKLIHLKDSVSLYNKKKIILKDQNKLNENISSSTKLINKYVTLCGFQQNA